MRTNYPYWKTKMTWFLQSINLDLWDVIEDSPTFPSKLIDEVMIPKPKQEWDECDRKKSQLNAKVVYTLQCVMDRNEYNRICQCKLAKEIWKLLVLMKEQIELNSKKSIYLFIVMNFFYEK